MQTKVERHTLCVLVARFQVPSLSEAHIELINEALNNHPKVLIVLGLSPTRGTLMNPLDYTPRRQMILEAFPHSRFPQLSVGYIKDTVSDEVWSKKLDEIVADHLSPMDTAILYGGRDSFLKFYTTNTFPTRELMSSRYISGTEIRKQIAEAPQSSPDFRAGAIWAAFQRYPTVYATVDVIPVDENNRVLLARKADEKKYRFVGGFASPGDESYEVAAARELKEETGLDVELDALYYMGSQKVDDWRYRAEKDKIITHLYLAAPLHCDATASDDIAEVRWFEWDHFHPNVLVDSHAKLWEVFIPKITKELKTKQPTGTFKIL